MRRLILAAACVLTLCSALLTHEASAQEPRAFGQVWGTNYGLHDSQRFYHYPYVFYPQNYWGNEYYRSAESLYYRYPQEMRIPVYNKKWHNELPQPRRYHWGHHFVLDYF